jgi:hypothetical protein
MCASQLNAVLCGPIVARDSRLNDATPEAYARVLGRHGFMKLASPRAPESLSSFYQRIPFRYPALFEALCLSYSWSDAVVGEVEFAANPPGEDLAGLSASVRYDPHLWAFLVPRGYLIFGRMSGGRYDPCAFNMTCRKGTEAPVVRVDHEEILSFQRLGQPSLLAASFSVFLKENLPREGRRRITRA